MQPEAEYVDPASLSPYREYAWSREYNRRGRAAWDALRDDVAQNGFLEAAMLMYNHATGEGYLGEGNHRVGVAIELGIPVPLVIYRSMRTAPDYPMKRVTAPGAHSMRDERGFSRFRQVMKPSDIGLPTVPGRGEKAVDDELAAAVAREPADR